MPSLFNSTTSVARGRRIYVDRRTVCPLLDENLEAITCICSEPA